MLIPGLSKRSGPAPAFLPVLILGTLLQGFGFLAKLSYAL